MSQRPPIPWTRILPHSGHRWAMGLRPGELGPFIQPWDPRGEILTQRQSWLQQSASDYSALTPACREALRETVQLIRDYGISIPEHDDPEKQLLALGREWESDFVWMIKDPSNMWTLGGGVVCFPSSWSMPAKLGMSMREVHAPVPGLNESLGSQIDTFLTRMEPGQAWLRENAGLSRDSEKNHLPTRPRRTLDDTVTGNEVHIRVEHQLLYKLPKCGAILFGIRVEVFPWKEVIANKDAITGLQWLLRSIAPEAARYKGMEHVRLRLLDLISALPD